MTSREFCYWLQGYFELNGGGKPIDPGQAEAIRRHLALVFKHEIDPSYGDAAHQADLNETHGKPNTPEVSLPPPPGGFSHGPPVLRC